MSLAYSFRFSRLACSALIRVYEPCDADADDIQSKHRRGQDAHIKDVAGRGDNTCDHENCQYRIADIAPHPTGANHSHQRKKKDQNGHLKNQPEPKDHGKK